MSVPRRGDIIHTSLNPTQGKEIKDGDNGRLVLVLSPEPFNRASGLLLVAPITQGVTAGSRENGFAVTLMGSGSATQGVILCDQVRTIDARARKCRFVERLSEVAVNEALDAVRSLLD